METTNGNKAKKTLIVIGFILSFLLGFALLVFSVWGDVESQMFDAMYKGDERLSTLKCPVVLTPQDEEQFSATISNPIDEEIKPAVRVHVSSSFLDTKREENLNFELAPKESRKLAWQVSPSEAEDGNMILVKVFLFRDYPISSKHATCGIWVLDIPLIKGNQLIYGSFALSAIGMIATTALWPTVNKPMGKKAKELFRAFYILSAIIILATIGCLLGKWLIGVLGIVAGFLMAIGTITEYFK